MLTAPTVSAIVLNYRSALYTMRCIEALRMQTIADRIEIIVVDNDSGDNSVKVLRTLLGHGHNIKLIQSPKNVGYGQGNVLGVASATGEYILIVNPDTSLLADAAEIMTDYLRDHPDVGMVGPKLVFRDGTTRDSFRTFPTPADVLIKRTFLRYFFPRRMSTYLQWDRSPEDIRDVDWLVGACFVMRRNNFIELGGFDPRFFLFFEDIDLCRRIWKSGKRVVYLPLATADDSKNRLSSGGLFSLLWKKTVRIHVASAIKYFWKWRGQS